ncbi:MAG: cytidylate kinase-like family protein [Syntrophales bacterium]|jgi:cytidylate kinase|nr:cytidylate kinase-like family protein [Syntrophales bacterium]MCK9527786.1 cytidylate kinase-like family protein [Syntrophales bacterium]MDX9922117.1 cytidylate kinase-like family protein [Syntrophales bacterium]
MATKLSKSARLESILEEQVLRWQKQSDRRKTKATPKKPVITVSRQPGIPMEKLMERLAAELELDVFDNEIIHAVAKSVKMSEKVVATLDEKTRGVLDNWIQVLKSTRYLLPDTYITHLTKVIGAIAEQGGAIIMGRGANLILPPEKTTRIRFVAPMGVRMVHLSKDVEISSIDAAQRMIAKKEAEQQAYIRKYFEVDIDDPVHYDLIINTHFMADEKIIEMIKAGVKTVEPPRRRRSDRKPGE